MSHETRAECIKDEDYLPGPEDETVVGEETIGEMHIQTVECPTCGRQYDHVFDYEGVWDPEALEYVSWSETVQQARERMQEHGVDVYEDFAESPGGDSDNSESESRRDSVNIDNPVSVSDFETVEKNHDGLSYNVVVESPDGKRYERVYILDRLTHDGDTIHSF